MSLRVSTIGNEAWIARSGHTRVSTAGVEVWTNLTIVPPAPTGPTGPPDITGPTGTPPPQPVECDVCFNDAQFTSAPPWLYNFTQITR